MDGLNQIIQRLEAQKAAVEQALEALREVGGEVSGGSASSPGDRRSAAQKARWAAKRKAEAASMTPAKRKRGISAAARKALAEAMRRRWAVKRAAAAKKKGGRAKKAA